MSRSAQHFSPQDAFARHWFPDGYPLWNPKPVLLPPLRQEEGIKIGDIGVIDRDGCFDALFNICDPRDRALEHEYGFPPGFTRIRQPRIINYSSFRPGYVFSSPETPWFSRSVDMPYFTNERTMVAGRVGTHYTANLIEDGAYIVVPQGAKCFKLALQWYRQFESQANDYWSTWFNFATQQLGPLRSLYLITGVHRTRSWALASFKRDGQRIEVTCELVEEEGKLQADDSQWTPLGRFASKIGPSGDSQEHDNQTIFIQSFTITPNGTVRHPNREQLASPEEFSVTESAGESIDRENTSQASHRAESALSMPGGWFHREVATSRATLTRADSTTIQHVPETTLPVHPSEIVNRYLLTKHPSAEVAVTHDSAWIIMLTRGQLSKLEDLESAIDAIVSEHYNIVFRNGVVSLGNKDVSLARFGVHRSDLPVDLTDCIQQDSEAPHALYPFRSIYRGSLRITDTSVVKVAIKVIMIRATDDSSLSEKETKAQHMTDEFALLDHINVLPLIWASIEPGRLMLTFPWTERTLTSYIDGVHNKLTDIQILALVHDVAAGLHYLHTNGIIHGCLSGAAVVIDAKGTALLADYGLSTFLNECGFPLFGGMKQGTARWAAPESLRGDGSITRNALTEENDTYSFSGIMLQVLSGKVPYHYYKRDEDVVSAILMRETPKRPDSWRLTDDRWLFIQQCWSDSRPSSKDIVEFAKRDLDVAFQKSHQDTNATATDALEHSTLDDHNSGIPATDAMDVIHTEVDEMPDAAVKDDTTTSQRPVSPERYAGSSSQLRRKHTPSPHTVLPLSHALPHIAKVEEGGHDVPLLRPTRNASGEIDIIFIGETNVGDSSLINMVRVMDTPDGPTGAAMVSNDARGPSQTTHPALEMGPRCRLWDTRRFYIPLTYRGTLLWNGTFPKILPPGRPLLTETLYYLTQQGSPILVWCIDAAKIEMGDYWLKFCTAHRYYGRKAIPAVVITRGSPQPLKPWNEGARCAEQLQALDLGVDIPIVVVRRYESTSSVEYKEDSKALRDFLFELMSR